MRWWSRRLLPAVVCALMATSVGGSLYTRLFGESASICEDAAPLGATCACPHQQTRLYQGADCSARNISRLPLELQLPYGIPTVTLEQNAITVVRSQQFSHNSAVKTMRMSKNELRQLEPQAFSQLPGLQTILLDHNHLTDIDQGAFEGLSQLERLDLGFNELRSIRPELFAGTRIRELQLHYNPLVTLDPSTFFYLPRLQILDLDNTDLSELPAGLFTPNQELITLLLPHNQLSVVPSHAISAASALRTLDLSGNLIETLPTEAFHECPSLKRIVLSSMHELTKIEDNAFSGLDELEELLVQFNPKLDYLSTTAFKDKATGEHLMKLTRLDLKENNLDYFAKETLPWERMEYVDLEMNPWNCDCEMSWVAEAEYNFKHEPLVKCSSPEPVKGRRIASLKAEEFVCEDEAGNIALIVFLVLLGIGVVAGLIFVFWRFKVCQKVKAKLFVRPKYANVKREVDRVEVEGMEWDNRDIGV